ncbi:MAG: hypothetical protein NTZ93_01855 [Candidatus Beckwithbacteria bacterium]|nr:hypothetical protein [Candidatus Beckwithbacteria bacterium]
MTEKLFTVPLNCADKCPFNKHCGTGIASEEKPCKTEIQDTERLLSQEDGVTGVRHEIMGEEVYVFTSDWEIPNYNEWRMWEGVARIENGEISYL